METTKNEVDRFVSGFRLRRFCVVVSVSDMPTSPCTNKCLQMPQMPTNLLFVFFILCFLFNSEKAKNVDVKTEEKKQDLKAKLTNLSKVT